MGFLSRANPTKKGFIKGAVAVTIIASAFGYLMRDLINFGKSEGDMRPAKVAQAEKRIFKEALIKLEDFEISSDKVSSIQQDFENLTFIIGHCEDLKIAEEEYKIKGDFYKAKDILIKIQKYMKIVGNEKDFKNLDPKIFPKEAAELILKILAELKEDIAIELAFLEHEIKSSENNVIEAARKAHQKVGGK